MISVEVIYDHRKRIEGPIEVRVTYQRKTYYIGTGIRVHHTNFVSGTIINQADAVELNQRLKVIVARVQAEITKCITDGKPIIAKKIKERAYQAVLDADPDATPLIDWCDDQIAMLRISEGTRKHYRAFARRLRDFGKISHWQDLTVENIYEFDHYIHQLPAGLHTDEKISDAATYNYHKCFKALLNRACSFGIIVTSPYYRLKGKFKRGDSEKVEYLTESEVQAFESLNPPAGTKMAIAKDLFIFQCYTGLSYSDTQVFDISQYKCMSGKWIHVGERVKTGTPYISQLLEPAVKVLRKYGMKIPQISNDDYNHCLKPLGEVAGIRFPLHSHIARHTFATMMLRYKVPIENVSAMLGHTNIKQTQRYAKVMAKSVYEDFDRVADLIKKDSED